MANSSLVSIIIPSRNEKYLGKTIEDLLAKATEEIEIIAVLDGYWPQPKIIDNDRLILIHRGSSMGMRAAINAATAIARGRYLMKCDAHCLFAPGFDQILKNDCEKNCVVIPRRFALDAEKWEVLDNPKYPIDYMYLSKDLHG
ncbi:glycosyltransferase, partial [Candidatus Woesebacteria bacterium]|nr:glycosyltransferase [Candidatus Woesebacteria bacterium]